MNHLSKTPGVVSAEGQNFENCVDTSAEDTATSNWVQVGTACARVLQRKEFAREARFAELASRNWGSKTFHDIPAEQNRLRIKELQDEATRAKEPDFFAISLGCLGTAKKGGGK